MFFLFGCLAMAAGLFLMGAGYPHQPNTNRYEVDFDEIEGMKNRLSIEITDHWQRKAHLYIVPPTLSSLTDRNAVRSTRIPPVNPPQLVATIDLDSAGKDSLKAYFKEHVYAPQPY